MPNTTEGITETRRAADENYDGIKLLRLATHRHGIHLSVLIAETSLWASPEVHRRLLEENGSGVYYPNMRRKRNGENRRVMCGGDFLDDNTYANYAIKYAVGISRSKIVNFAACHIWPKTCYDSR